MRFIDLNYDTPEHPDHIITLQELRDDFREFSEPDETFTFYLVNVLDAYLRGRNDLYCLDFTELEVIKLMNRFYHAEQLNDLKKEGLLK